MNRDRSVDETGYVREQYSTCDNLAVRVATHFRYGVPHVDFPDWVLSRIPWQGNERVLDAGSGTGLYAAPVRKRTPDYVAADLSWGMLRNFPSPQPPRINMDVQQIPIAAGIADVVLANHMLYHIPDQGAAVAELKRVLRPAGYLLAATNSDSNMAELAELGRRVEEELGIESLLGVRPRLSFTLENGGVLLQRHFRFVERHDLPGALVFPEAQPVIDYLASNRRRYTDHLPPHLTWDDIARTIRRLLDAHIAVHGAYRVSKLTGIFVCRNDG